jgi:hypothetical protein
MAQTFQVVVDAIKAAGEEAHAASMDAHGYLVPTNEAYDFIRQVWYDSEDSRYDLLPEWMPNGFKQAYRAGSVRRG